MPPQLPTRKLGKNGPQVTALGFGAMGLSAFYGAPQSDEERFKFLDHLYESGQTFLDTADIYMDNEDLLGKWFKRTGKRNEIFLATKFAGVITDKGMSVDTSPAYVRQACEKSLGRLGTDHIDLYYAHRLDGVTPIEKTVEAMAELRKEGKINYLGLSECSADSLRRACKVSHIDAVQMEYSPFAMDIESEATNFLKTARELGVAVICYSPLGRGILTGQYKSAEDFEEGDFRRGNPRWQGENFKKNMELVETLKKIATKKGCTSGQLSLAWLLAQGGDIIPIPGTKKTKYFDENMGALNVKLTPEEVAEVRKAIAASPVSGDRYPEAMLGALFGDTPPLTG